MLPILSVALAIVLAAAAALVKLPQVVSGKVVNAEFAEQAAVSDPATADGNQLVAQAARQALALPGIEAKTRQRVNLFDQNLVGSGTYYQLRQDNQVLLRMDLKLRVSDEMTSSLQQISDGHFFWIRRDLPHLSELSRINLKRVEDAVRQLKHPPPPTHWLALGGLPKLLATLSEQFDFEPAVPITVGQSQGWALWRVEGHWKPQALARLVTASDPQHGQPTPPTTAQLPTHIPHGVTLSLGRDQLLPLFPYTISFFRDQPEPTDVAATTPATRQVLLTWELFEVRLRPDLTPAFFDYRPGDQEVQDRTREFLERLAPRTAAGRGRPGKTPPPGS